MCMRLAAHRHMRSLLRAGWWPLHSSCIKQLRTQHHRFQPPTATQPPFAGRVGPGRPASLQKRVGRVDPGRPGSDPRVGTSHLSITLSRDAFFDGLRPPSRPVDAPRFVRVRAPAFQACAIHAGDLGVGRARTAGASAICFRLHSSFKRASETTLHALRCRQAGPRRRRGGGGCEPKHGSALRARPLRGRVASGGSDGRGRGCPACRCQSRVRSAGKSAQRPARASLRPCVPTKRGRAPPPGSRTAP
jgi:hypothetical protein